MVWELVAVVAEVPAYVCSHVFEDTRPVLLVSRADGDWQCLCGAQHAPNELPRVVGLKDLIDRDASIGDLWDLPTNWEADRAFLGSNWCRRKLQ